MMTSCSTDKGSFQQRMKRPEYETLHSRTLSYDSWPNDHALLPDNLAKAGFFYCGFDDRCRCFHCGGGIGRWEPNDDPAVEHARLFPGCQYIRHYMGDAFVDAVEELTSQNEGVTLDQLERYMKRTSFKKHGKEEGTPKSRL